MLKKLKKQKILLFACLKDLYIEFKKSNSQLKMGFKKFCELPLKWYIAVTRKDSHNVCVSSYHQNVKLLYSAIPGNLDYKEYMNLCVCDLADRNCMFHFCKNCPDITNLSNYLKNIFEGIDFDDDDKINYKQWVVADRIILACTQSTVDEFIHTATEMIYDLCHHHFIKNSLASYLQDSKENLDNKTCIILMDFAESYSFIKQNAIQGFYWQNIQASMHPFAAYYRDLSRN